MSNSTHFSSMTVGSRDLTETTTLTLGDAGKVLTLNAAAGFTVTLPAATGSGAIYEFHVVTTITSNNYIIKVANSTDVMTGMCIWGMDAVTTVIGYETAGAGTSDTITLNGTTTGGILGGIVRLRDVSAGNFSVFVTGAATGAEATPFTATV